MANNNKVLIGGTFDYLHKGHQKLIDKAFEMGAFVFIGLTSDEFVSRYKKYKIRSYRERERQLREYLKKYSNKYVIKPLNDQYGPSINEDYDVIIVSKETYNTALEINVQRKKKLLKTLKIVVVEQVLAEDLFPINSSRINLGEIDENGNRLKPILINVGSENPLKIKAVNETFSSIFSDYAVKGIRTENDVSFQPFGADTISGAYNRAKNVINNADYAIGIEAGLIWNAVIQNYFDVHYVAILDKFGYCTYGHSAGFLYPKEIIELVNKGKSIEKAMETYAGIEKIGTTTGAVAYFSKYRISRIDLIKQGLLTAMIPRLSFESYHR